MKCDLETLKNRVINEDRKARLKTSSVDTLVKLLAENNFVKIPRDNCLEIDTDMFAPKAAAQLIIDSFKLY